MEKQLREMVNIYADSEKFRMPESGVVSEMARILGAKDNFQVLDVDRFATSREIRGAHNRLQKQLHPDILGKRVGDFIETANRVTGIINVAYQELKDPRTFYDTIYNSMGRKVPAITLKQFAQMGPREALQFLDSWGKRGDYREGKRRFEQMSPTGQLKAILDSMLQYSATETSQSIVGGRGAMGIIGSMIGTQREAAEIIARAYSGEPGFQPRNGRPLPDIDLVLNSLGATQSYPGRQSKTIMNEFGFTMHADEFPHWAKSLGVEDPWGWVDIFRFPMITQEGILAEVGFDPSSWLHKFIELNHLPSIETGEKLNRRAERILSAKNFGVNLVSNLRGVCLSILDSIRYRKPSVKQDRVLLLPPPSGKDTNL